MELIEATQRYGWLAVLIVWTLDKLFPRLWTFFTDKFFPARARERAEDAQAKREAEAILLKSKIEREVREEEHRIKMDERIANALEQMTGSITINNERLSQLITITSDHDEFTNTAIGDMRVTVAKMNKRESQPKIKRPRVTK